MGAIFLNFLKKNMKWSFYFTMIIIPILFVEIFLRLISTESGTNLRILNKPWYTLLPLNVPSIDNFSKSLNTEAYKVYDPILGWKINKNGKQHPYYSNAQGLRVKKKDFSSKIRVNSADIITIGDSFTHGDEVLFEETWPFFLEQISNKKVVNLGTSAYGFDQAILSYINSPVKAETVILGLISRDLERATDLLYPGIYYGGIKSKPIFNFDDNNEYKILNQPCLSGLDLYSEFELGEKSNFMKIDKNFDEMLFKKEFLDYFFSYKVIKMLFYRKKYISKAIYLTPDTDRYRYVLKIFEIFYNECLNNNDIPIIAFLDNNNSFTDRKIHKNPWTNLRIDLQRIGFKIIEPSDSLLHLHNENPNNIINYNGVHYTPIANKIVAKHIYNNF
tara:strand:- start:192 stop:1358 length:1167 start_codon:yes stop_codon:yes gene_type:complete